MSDFFEIDPVSGIRSDFKWNENDQEYTINRVQDVEPLLEATQFARNEGGMNSKDIKRGWWHYACIPPIVEIQLRAKGIDIHNPDHAKRLLEEINTNFPHLKMTTGKMGGKTKIHG
jgi:hypothetical protein